MYTKTFINRVIAHEIKTGASYKLGRYFYMVRNGLLFRLDSQAVQEDLMPWKVCGKA